MRLATIRSRPLEMQESRAMGLQERGEVLSFLPTFGSIATSASFQLCGKWFAARHLLYRSWIAVLMCSQHALRSRTVTLSVPREVLEIPIVFRSISSSETPWFQGRWPEPFQLDRGSVGRSSESLYLSSIDVRRASALPMVSSIVWPLIVSGGALRFKESLCHPMTL